MTCNRRAAILACALGSVGWAVRCTTRPETGLLGEYERYVSSAEGAMAARFDSRELFWVPASSSKEATQKLAAGHAVRLNVTDGAFNRNLVGRNGAITHWIGAIRIPDATLGDVGSVMEDYEAYSRVYSPLIFECRAARGRGSGGRDDLVLGLRGVYRVGGVFPQQYTFQAKTQIERSLSRSGDVPAIRMHLRATEIRESESGIVGREDFLEAYHDHGIMWGLNAYWRAWERGQDVYLEFETITLARSAQAFVCKLGFLPVPKSILFDAMEFFPAESVRTILEGTKAECGRRASQHRGVQPAS